MHAKKIALSEEDENEHNTPAHVEDALPKPPAPASSYTRMDAEMHSILLKKNISDFDKWVQYEQVLHRYLRKLEIHKKRRTGKDSASKTSSDVSTTTSNKPHAIAKSDEASDIAAGSNALKARLLYGFLEKASCLEWDADGRVSIMGTPTDASVKDYIEASMQRRPPTTPDGWNLYVTALKSLKIPPGYVTNQELREVLKEEIPASAHQSLPRSLTNEEPEKHVRCGKTSRWSPY